MKIDLTLNCDSVYVEYSNLKYQVEAKLVEVETNNIIEEMISEVGTQGILEELDIEEIVLFLKNSDYNVEKSY